MGSTTRQLSTLKKLTVSSTALFQELHRLTHLLPNPSEMAKLFALVLSISVAVLAAASERECFDKCRFRFCYEKSSFEVDRTPDVPFTGPICEKKGDQDRHCRFHR